MCRINQVENSINFGYHRRRIGCHPAILSSSNVLLIQLFLLLRYFHGLHTVRPIFLLISFSHWATHGCPLNIVSKSGYLNARRETTIRKIVLTSQGDTNSYHFSVEFAAEFAPENNLKPFHGRILSPINSKIGWNPSSDFCCCFLGFSCYFALTP